MSRTSKFTVIIYAIVFLLPLATICIGQDRKKIDKFIKNNVFTEVEILYSNDSVPQTLNLIFKGVLKSHKNSQIIIPSELFSEYFYSNDLFISKSGRVIISNPDKIKNDTAFISVNLKGDKNLSQTLKIPLNYKGTLILDYSGQNGRRGENGEDGKDGRITIPKTVYPEIGTNGQHGSYGRKGDDLQIFLTRVNSISKESSSLFTILVHNLTSSKTDTFKIDILSSKLIIMSNGGNGGDGGLGGNGGNGSDGLRNPGYTSYGQFGALGGCGGNGGAGGDGGQISIFIDFQIADFYNNIQVVNRGGQGGKGGEQGKIGSRGINYSRGQEFTDVRTIRNMHKDMPNLNGLDGIQGRDGPKPQMELVIQKE